MRPRKGAISPLELLGRGANIAIVALVLTSGIIPYVSVASPETPFDSQVERGIESYLSDDELGHSLDPVTYRGERYITVVVEQTENGNGVLLHSANAFWRGSLTRAEYWRKKNVEKVLVFEKRDGGAALVTDPRTIRRVIGAKASEQFSQSLTSEPLNDWAVEFQDTTLYGGSTELYFAWEKHGLTNQATSESDRYLVALQAMTTVDSRTAYVPEDIRERLEQAQNTTAATERALDIASKLDAKEHVEIAGRNVDSELTQRTLQKFAKDVKYVEDHTDDFEYAGSLANLILDISEQRVYSEERIEMLERIQAYNETHPEVSLDPALDDAITRLQNQHRDTDAKTRAILAKWIREEGVDFGVQTTKVVAKKFGSWMVTHSSLANSVSTYATSGTSGVLLSGAASAAGAAAFGWNLGGIVTGRSGIYTGMKRAEYSRYAMYEFQNVSRHVRETDGADLSGSDDYTDAALASTYRAATYYEFRSREVFYREVHAAMKSSLVDDAIEGLYNTLINEDRTSKQRWMLELARENADLVDYVNSTTVDMVYESYPAPIGSGAPTRPINQEPRSDSPATTSSVTLDWKSLDPEGDSITYDVYLERESTNPDRRVATDVTESKRTVSLEPGTTYSWKVVATDEDGWQSESRVWSFETAEASDEDGSVESPTSEDETSDEDLDDDGFDADSDDGLVDGCSGGSEEASDLREQFTAIGNLLVFLIGAVAVPNGAYGLLEWTTAGSDVRKGRRGKKRIRNTFVGLAGAAVLKVAVNLVTAVLCV